MARPVKVCHLIEVKVANDGELIPQVREVYGKANRRNTDKYADHFFHIVNP